LLNGEYAFVTPPLEYTQQIMTTSLGRKYLPLRIFGCVLLILAAAKYSFSTDRHSSVKLLKVDPIRVDFGTVAVGTRTQPQTVTLTNSGTAPLPIASILVSGIDFAQSNNCGEQLAAGAQCSVQITFQPAILGPRLGTAIITTTNDPGSPNLLVLNGVGE
jgi:hypothetical protein